MKQIKEVEEQKAKIEEVTPSCSAFEIEE